MTTVLTMAFIGIDNRRDLPRVSYSTALDYYVGACFAFVLSSILQFASVHYFTKIGSGEEPGDDDDDDDDDEDDYNDVTHHSDGNDDYDTDDEDSLKRSTIDDVIERRHRTTACRRQAMKVGSGAGSSTAWVSDIEFQCKTFDVYHACNKGQMHRQG